MNDQLENPEPLDFDSTLAAMLAWIGQGVMVRVAPISEPPDGANPNVAVFTGTLGRGGGLVEGVDDAAEYVFFSIDGAAVGIDLRILSRP